MAIETFGFTRLEPVSILDSESLLSSTTGFDKPHPTLNSTGGRAGVILANIYHGLEDLVTLEQTVSFGVEHLVILAL